MSATLLTISMLTGFFGDMCLQILCNAGFGGKSGWGLNEYFAQHGRVECLFIATGMMGLFYAIYFDLLKLPPNWYYLAVYGIVLDLLFRLLVIFPSLNGYYSHLNYFWSGFWGAVPMLIPLGIYMAIIHIDSNKI